MPGTVLISTLVLSSFVIIIILRGHKTRAKGAYLSELLDLICNYSLSTYCMPNTEPQASHVQPLCCVPSCPVLLSWGEPLPSWQVNELLSHLGHNSKSPKVKRQQKQLLLCLTFFFSFKFYWSIVDWQCCDNFCWRTKWFSSMYTHIHSFFNSSPMWIITEYWVEYPVLCRYLSGPQWPYG